MQSPHRLVGRVVATLFGLLGLGLLFSPLLGAGSGAEANSAVVPLAGVMMLAAAVTVWLLRGSGPDAAKRTSLERRGSGDALCVALRPTTPLVMVVLGVTGVVLALAAVVGVGIGDGGVLFAPLVVLFALLVPDAARALARRPSLVITADTVAYRGWTLDAELAWDDVSSVRLEGADPSRSRVVLSGRPLAASWRVSSHRVLLPLDRVPGRPEISLLSAALDEPSRVQVLLGRFCDATAGERAAYLDEDGVRFLSGGH